MATQALKPRLDLLKKRFGEDKDRITKETNVLYEQAGVDPSAGCLPSLATIPVFVGLYSSLSNAAADGLFQEGFFWIPTLAGPTTVAARQAGSGTAWLYPFVDNAPPIGWDAAAPYLVLPAMLLVSMYVSSYLTTPPPAKDDPNANVGKVLTYGLPLMVGYFSLCVPSGLSLYYLSNSVFSTIVTVYLKKFGGADVVMNELGPVTAAGSGRRMGTVVAAFEGWAPTTVVVDPKAADDEAVEMDEEERAASIAALKAEEEAAAAAAEAARLDPGLVSRRVKRRALAAMQESQLRGAKLAGMSQGLAAQASAAREEAAAREAAAAEAKEAAAKEEAAARR
jgi:YidC/Oxa1 family membrane protein insertase